MCHSCSGIRLIRVTIIHSMLLLSSLQIGLELTYVLKNYFEKYSYLRLKDPVFQHLVSTNIFISNLHWIYSFILTETLTQCCLMAYLYYLENLISSLFFFIFISSKNSFVDHSGLEPETLSL